ncbi:MAG: peptidase U34, partial [Candidatus Helarchaeota archaeon]|nr:peptidase U34 [Candidatus Helarchaeota archaeon]
MCDTLVAVGLATSDGSTIFGKNSDRPYAEVQNLIHVPRQEHSEANLKCTYIEIPQIPETFEVILCQPYWMWGAEMEIGRA